jgi:hypothetical protein
VSETSLEIDLQLTSIERKIELVLHLAIGGFTVAITRQKQEIVRRSLRLPADRSGIDIHAFWQGDYLARARFPVGHSDNEPSRLISRHAHVAMTNRERLWFIYRSRKHHTGLENALDLFPKLRFKMLNLWCEPYLRLFHLENVELKIARHLAADRQTPCMKRSI